MNIEVILKCEAHEQQRVVERAVHEHQRSEEQAEDTSGAEQAETRDLHLEDEQHDAKHDEGDAGVVDRQDLEREKRQEQADATGDARQNRSRVPQLDGQAVGTKRLLQVCDLWLGQRAQDALRPGQVHATAKIGTRNWALGSLVVLSTVAP